MLATSGAALQISGKQMVEDKEIKTRKLSSVGTTSPDRGKELSNNCGTFVHLPADVTGHHSVFQLVHVAHLGCPMFSALGRLTYVAHLGCPVLSLLFSPLHAVGFQLQPLLRFPEIILGPKILYTLLRLI